MDIRRDASGRPLVPTSHGEDVVHAVDVITGHERTLTPASLDPLTDESPLATVASALPTTSEPPLDTIHDERALGLLVVLDAAGARPVEALLEIEGLCESDLHGVAGELRAAGLLAETDVDGQRGYRVTDDARAAIDLLRD